VIITSTPVKSLEINGGIRTLHELQQALHPLPTILLYSHVYNNTLVSARLPTTILLYLASTMMLVYLLVYNDTFVSVRLPTTILLYLRVYNDACVFARLQ
jgi:hypothetical protein